MPGSLYDLDILFDDVYCPHDDLPHHKFSQEEKEDYINDLLT